MPDAVRSLLDLLIFGGFVGSVFAGTHWLNSRVGGWRRLARRYPRRLLWAERRAVAGRVVMGRRFHAAYKASALHVVVGPEGVGLEVAMARYRLFHPPLLLPWSAIAACGQPTPRGRKGPETVLILGQPSLEIRVRGEAAEVLLHAWRRYGAGREIPSADGAAETAG